MPSWNIHTAHVERLEREFDLESLGIRDRNTFLFGNFVPDIYVGYMVPDASMRIDYRLTHMTRGGTIPEPNAGKYWEFYGSDKRWEPDELIYGVWAHLVCDHVYNQATHEFLDSIGERANNIIREKKQGDFELFGRTLTIREQVRLTTELVDACRRYRQYRILEEDVERAVRVADGIVDSNREKHIEGTPEYRLLTEEFFSATFERVHETLVRGLEDIRSKRD